MALHAMGQYDEALKDYETGQKLDPENAQIKQGLEKCLQDKKAGEEEEKGMFGPQAMMKLMANPRIAAYF
jgi:cytochrome c-type biogenesis protein CcmH/NrfG